MLTGPVMLEVVFYLSRPKRRRKGGPAYPTGGPEADNVAKAIMDALEGYVYRHDGQVAGLVVWKLYGDRPRAEVTVIQLDEEGGTVQERVCPKCGRKWYSAVEEQEYWICNECGAKIPRPKLEQDLNKTKCDQGIVRK